MLGLNVLEHIAGNGVHAFDARLHTSIWIIVALVAARSAAMAFNRLADVTIDAANPRTRIRALPAGQLTVPQVVAFTVVTSALLVFASYMLNRVRRPDFKAEITSPTPTVTSINGVRVERQQPLAFAREADVVLVGSGFKTQEVVADPARAVSAK